MHSKDARIECCCRSRVVEDASVCSRTKALSASVELPTNCREFAADALRRDAFKLAHPVVGQHHAEEGPLTAEVSAVMWEVASEDRSVPPPHALGIHAQRGSPERSLRVVQDTGEFVTKGLPGPLRREAAGLVEARVFTIPIAGQVARRLIHPSEDASSFGPLRAFATSRPPVSLSRGCAVCTRHALHVATYSHDIRRAAQRRSRRLMVC